MSTTLVESCTSNGEFCRCPAAASICCGSYRPAREIRCHQKLGNWNRRTRIMASGLKGRDSDSAGDSSYLRLRPHGPQDHGTDSKLQATTRRVNQTIPYGDTLTVDSNSQSTLQTLPRITPPLLKNGEMNEYVENVRKHLRNVVNGETSLDHKLWIVSRLERLGISRYFEEEIVTCLEHVNRFWSNDYGLGWDNSIDGGGETLQDLNATATAFRLLRTHGFDVKEDCFKRFVYKGDQVDLTEKTDSNVPVMLNLLRASQTLFPGESVLKEARAFTRNYLKRKFERQECGDHAAEVEFALKFPGYTSLPRLEHRSSLNPSHKDDAQVFALADADFHLCQELHRQELAQVMQWNATCQFSNLDFARQKVLECYFSAAATLFEPELAQARVVWSQCYVLITILDDYFDNCAPLEELRIFLKAVKAWDPALVQGLPERARVLFNGLYETVNAIAAEAFITQGRDVSHHLRSYWDRWLTACLTESQWTKSGYVPSFDEYMAIAEVTISLETIVCSAFFFTGEKISEEALLSDDYHTPLHLLCRVSRILNDITGIERETLEGKKSSVHLYMLDHPGASESDAVAYLQELVDSTMQELTKEVLRTTALPQSSKRLHLHMAKVFHTFYRDTDAYCVPTELLAESIDKVLFAPLPGLALLA
nr:isoprene synthase [Calohypnum plumiforme]